MSVGSINIRKTLIDVYGTQSVLWSDFNDLAIYATPSIPVIGNRVRNIFNKADVNEVTFTANNFTAPTFSQSDFGNNYHLSFNKNDGSFYNYNFLASQNGFETTIFLVYKTDQSISSGIESLLWIGSNSSQNDNRILIYKDYDVSETYVADGTGLTVSLSDNDLYPNILAYRCSGSFSTVFINDKKYFYELPSTAINYSYVRLGAEPIGNGDSNSTINQASVKIAELIIVTQSITFNEFKEVYYYLHNKYQR
jgi:hypothetical protein